MIRNQGPWDLLGKEVEIDGPVMAKAAGQNADVEDGVVEAELVEEEENGADGIEQAAGHEPEEAGGGKHVDERLDEKNDGPAHEDVHGGGQDVEAAGEEEFEADADGGGSPDDAEDESAGAVT